MEERTRYRNHFIEIYQDENCMNPREWSDHLGVMVFSHTRYSLGDADHGIDFKKYDSWDAVERGIRRKYKGTVLVMPVRMYDHSGITISVSNEYPYNDYWDSGKIGFIFTTKERIRKWYQKKLISKKTMAKAKHALLYEIEEYDQYLRGDVYGYRIENLKGEEVDSCGNYYGDKYILKDAMSAVNSIVDGPRNGNRSYDRQQKAKSQLRDAKGRFIKKVA